ncbi:MAG: pallilysin-related adhesin [Treponema sp.]|jgi:hypothetical protein|nr:pallilysin-related adhesin [Treponema sp.]
MSKNQTFAAFIIFTLAAAGIAIFIFWPFSENEMRERHPMRVIIPGTGDGPDLASARNGYGIYEANYSLKAPLGDGETVISILNFDFDSEVIEEQIVAYRNQHDPENPISIAFFGYDEQGRSFRRLWNAPVAATMPGTVSMYSQDLLGDRSFCVVITGMNEREEHTMTVFRRDPRKSRNQPFAKIAELRIGGSITVDETDRPLSYQQGISGGQPFVIAASGHDGESNNMLDRVEIVYAYNPASGVYEQKNITRVPGKQVEERQLREILRGGPKVFEEFINDLWYHVTSEGTIDKNQYLYFDPANREIIFFGDETQQVFNWQHSNSTRFGLYIISQNISVSTLRRFLDIEIESLDSIHIKVSEDVRLKIIVSASWDGSYRRAGTATRASAEEKPLRPYTDAVYDSSMGRLRFQANGEYELNSSGALARGRYAFFRAGGSDLLELRPQRNGAKSENGDQRFIYTLTSMETANSTADSKNDNLSLSRVRLGASGIHEMHEPPVILIRAQ